MQPGLKDGPRIMVVWPTGGKLGSSCYVTYVFDAWAWEAHPEARERWVRTVIAYIGAQVPAQYKDVAVWEMHHPIEWSDK